MIMIYLIAFDRDEWSGQPFIIDWLLNIRSKKKKRGGVDLICMYQKNQSYREKDPMY
jgi:hypothetical protein